MSVLMFSYTVQAAYLDTDGISIAANAADAQRRHDQPCPGRDHNGHALPSYGRHGRDPEGGWEAPRATATWSSQGEMVLFRTRRGDVV